MVHGEEFVSGQKFPIRISKGQPEKGPGVRTTSKRTLPRSPRDDEREKSTERVLWPFWKGSSVAIANGGKRRLMNVQGSLGVKAEPGDRKTGNLGSLARVSIQVQAPKPM